MTSPKECTCNEFDEAYRHGTYAAVKVPHIHDPLKFRYVCDFCGKTAPVQRVK